MNNSTDTLKLSEVEQLCRLYLDCRMTLLEETELEYLLTHTDFDSQLISEVREIMGVAHKLRLTPAMRARRKRRRPWVAITGAAACLALILGTHSRSASEAASGADCIVYANGHQITGEAALDRAEADIERMERFMQQEENRKMAEQAKVDEFMNHNTL